MALTKKHPETGQALYAERRTGDVSMNDSAYVWRSRDGRVTLDATPEEDAEIHAYFDTDKSVSGR